MDYNELATKVKAKYPGSYDDMDNMTLAKSVVQKHPEYSDVTFDAQQPEPEQSNGMLDMVGNAIKQTPLGMAAQGANSFGEGVGKALDFTGIPVSDSIQKGAQSLFQPAKAAGVGVANQMAGQFNGQSPQETTNQTVKAMQPGYQPQGMINKIGSTVGENAAVVGAGMANPMLGAGAMMAQQAQGGKVSPLPLAMVAAKPLFEGGKVIGKKLFSAGTGVSEPAIDARFANPNLENSPTVTDLTHQLPQSVTELSNQISEADKNAWKTLSKSYNPPGMGYSPDDRAIPKDLVQNILDSTKKELSVYGGGMVGKASKQAAAALEGLSEDINNVGKFSGGKIKSLLGVDSSIPKNTFLPETTIKDIIQSLDSNINWSDDTAAPLNSALEKARMALDDILKKQNPEYAKAMEPVSKKMDLLKRTQQQFNIKSRPGEGYVPGTATEGNLNNVLNNNKSVVQGTLSDLGKNTGQDYLKQLQDAKYAKEFQPGMRAQGSRRTLFGGAIGTGVGHFTNSPTVGGMVGAGTGFMLDTQGGPIAAKVIDAVSKIPGITPETIRAIQAAIPAVTSATKQEKKTPTRQQVREFLDQANNDPNKARQLARKAGYSW